MDRGHSSLAKYKSGPHFIQRNCTDTFHPLGGGGVVWTKLQEVLSSVEDSISCKRSWAAPITASDQDKHEEHLRAAQESWVKATQVLKLIILRCI